MLEVLGRELLSMHLVPPAELGLTASRRQLLSAETAVGTEAAPQKA